MNAATTGAPPRTSPLFRPRAMGGLFSLYLLSRALGLLRETGTAYLFGTSVTADRLSASFIVASVVSIVVTETVYAFSIRSLGGTGEPDAPASLARFALRAALVITVAYAVLGSAITIGVLGGEGGAGQAAELGALLAPSVGAGAVIGAVNGQLTLSGRFALLTGSQALYSLGALGGILIILASSHAVGAGALAAGWSVGNVAAALLLAWRSGVVRPRGSTRSTIRARTVWLTGAPVAAAYSLTGLQALTDRAIAARLGQGSVAALGYADRLFLLPIGFVLAAVAPVVLGSIAGRADREATVARESARSLRAVLSVAAPVGLLLVGLSPLVVRAVFHYGAFGHGSVTATTHAFDGLAVGIAATSLYLVLFRVMQVAAPLARMTVAAATGAVLNAAVSVALGAWLGLFGVALGTSLVALAVILVQIRSVRPFLGPAWTASALRATALPVLVCISASLALIGVAHAADLGNVVRAVSGLGLAATSAVWLRLGSRDGAASD